MLVYFFSFFLVLSSFMVVISNHSVFSLLFLVASFIFSSCLLFLLECEFLAILYIIVYVGAIAILFLFALMMLETKLLNITKNKIKYFPLGFIFIGFLLLILILVTTSFNTVTNLFLGFAKNKYNYLEITEVFSELNTFNDNNYQNWYSLIDSTNDINIYSHVLYSYFVVQFLLSGLILLMVLIGVVYLTNFFESTNRQSSSFRQLSRKVFR